MESLYLIPSWFFGLGLVLELIFGAIVLAVALYSFRVYSYSFQRNIKLFAWGFLALAISYFSWAFVSWYVSSKISIGEGIVSLGDFNGLVLFGLYGHIFFFLLGIATLTYVTLGIKSQRTYTLLISLLFITIIFSTQKIIAFYFVASLLLFYIIIYYFLEYWYYGRRNQLAMLSFIFLFVGSVDFTFSAVHHIPYVLGHILYLIGYLFILINFIMMLRPLSRKEKNVKKKK